jgi:hypothetical protein
LSALRFGIALLGEGNPAVQQSFLNILKTEGKEFFFLKLRDAIRTAATDFTQRSRAFRKLEEKPTQHQHQKVNSLLYRRAEHSVESREYIIDLLVFLQLLCEGQNFKLQVIV